MAAEGSIDNLIIEVSSNSSAAVSDLDKLSKSLTRLNQALTGSPEKITKLGSAFRVLNSSVNSINTEKLNSLSKLKINESVINSVRNLSSALNQMPADTSQKLAGIGSLSALKGLSINASVGKYLPQIAQTLRTLPADTSQRIAGLAGLSALNGFAFSKSPANALQTLANAVRSLPPDSSSRLSGIGNALAPLKQLDGIKITSAVNAFGKLPNVLKQLDTVNVGTLTNQIQQLNTALQPLASTLSRMGTAVATLPPSMRNAISATNRAAQANRQLSASALGTRQSFGILITKIGAYVAALTYVKNAIAKCINESNTYIENMNLFEASMGQYTQSATEYGMKVQAALGIDFGDWARNQGVFMTLATGMGETADRAAVMSQQLTQLGYDISSFYNISVSDAMLKLQSGMAGELEPLRRLGWDLSNARMQLEANKLGIDANVESMTQAEKVGLRYYMIMNQVTQVHGDMARTIASPANQLRILQAQVTLAARAIGNVLIPALNLILPYAIAAAKAVRMLAESLAAFFGIDTKFEVDYSTLDTSGISTGAEAAEDALDKTGSAADKANKKLKEYKNTVMGFDELHKLNDIPEDTSGSGSGGKKGSGAGAGLDLPLDTYDFLAGLKDQLSAQTDEMAKRMVNGFKRVVPVVAGIGAGIASWKLGNAMLDGFKKFRELKAALAGSTLLARLGINATKVVKIIGGAAATIGVIVARFTDLYVNSEMFRRGLNAVFDVMSKLGDPLIAFETGFKALLSPVDTLRDAIGGLFDRLNIDTSWLDGLAAKFGDAFGAVDKYSKTLNLDFTDLGLTAAGMGMVISGVGAPFGVAILAFEGASIAIRKLGYAISPCIEQVDALADVSQETADKFGTSCDSMLESQKQLAQNKFSDDVVSNEDVENIEKHITDVKETILNNLDAKRNAELQNLDSLKGVVSDDTLNRMRQSIEQANNDIVNTVTTGQSRITEIYTDAAKNNRDLTQEECSEIESIQSQMQDALIQSSGATADEISRISSAMAHNQREAATSAASEVIKKAIQTRDETVAAAWETYRGQQAIAQGALEAGSITQQEYDQIVNTAWNTANSTTEAANEAYYGENGVVAKTKTGLGDAKNTVNMETGEIASNWDKFCMDVSDFWGTTTQNIQSGASTFMSNTGASLSQGMESIKSDFWTWYDGAIKPKTDNIMSNFEFAGSKITQFLSDPVGSIKGAWSGISTWFTANVANPIKQAFNTVPYGLERVINSIVGMLNSFHIDLPDPVKQITGWSDFSFRLSYVTLPKLAKGGFVDKGQLFVANERGAEMVGKMGSHSTVANNQQIVDGIEAGVYNAMIQAAMVMNSSTDGETGKPIQITVEVDGEVLGRKTYKSMKDMERRGLIPAFGL